MQITKPYSNQGSGAHGGRERRLKCMYTSQLTKKRKTWSDGTLKVYFSGGSYQCSLLDGSKLRETILVSRQLEMVEIQALKKNEEIELDFEGYLVTVSAGNPELEAAKIGPPLKLPKFVPPSRFVPPTRLTEQAPNTGNTATSSSFGHSKGPYKVSCDELDDIWDCDQPRVLHSTTAKPMQSDGAPPAFMAYSGPSAHAQQFGIQKASRPTSGPSVEATLRLTGANAPNDVSQPALTRFFAPTAPASVRSGPAPTSVSAPPHVVPAQHAFSNRHTDQPYSTDKPQNFNTRQSYPASASSNSSSHPPTEDQNTTQNGRPPQFTGLDSVVPSSQYQPPQSYHPNSISNNTSYQAAARQNNAYSHQESAFKTGTQPVTSSRHHHHNAPVPTTQPAQHSMPTHQSYRQSSVPLQPPQGSNNTAFQQGRTNNSSVAASAPRGDATKASYSTIISSSVWDSD